MKAKILLSLLIVIAFSACKKTKNEPVPEPIDSYIADNSFKIVAYMPSYKDPSIVDDSKYKMITHLFYAFLEPAAAGDGSLAPLSQPARFATVSAKAKANNVKMGIALAGNSAYYEAIAKSATARTKFVNNIVAFALNNGMAGVDMDWEYPNANLGSDATYVLLMKELSAALHQKQLFLSAAITAGVYAGGIREGIKAEIFPYVDFFNIMQYDGLNYDTAEPLNHASYKMSIASLDQWLTVKGMPKEKAIVGIPLYGRNSANGAKVYRDIEASGTDVNLNLASVDGLAYGFNGINLVKQKVILAKARANGIMFWEFSQDTNNANSLVKAANDQLGRTY